MPPRCRGHVPLLPLVRAAAADEARRVLRAASRGRGRREEGDARLALLRQRGDAAAVPVLDLARRRGRGGGLADRGRGGTARGLRRAAAAAPAAARADPGHAAPLIHNRRLARRARRIWASRSITQYRSCLAVISTRRWSSTRASDSRTAAARLRSSGAT